VSSDAINDESAMKVKNFLSLSLHLLASSPVVPDDGICANATWNQNGVIVAGGNGDGSELDQISWPYGLFVDDDAAVYVADYYYDRVVFWAAGASSGQVVAGGNGKGNQTNQLNAVTKVVVDKNGTMFICDHNNKRIQQWFKNDTHGQTVIANISCWGLAMDSKGSLYVSDDRHQVTKWPGGQIVAGGNGQGHALNQLRDPVHVFVDQDQSVFVADSSNGRVVQWMTVSKEGIVVAGENRKETDANQLNRPTAVIVDRSGTVYVADYDNHRVVRFPKGSTSGNVIMTEQGMGSGIPQLPYPYDLAFDRQGNLYVTELLNNRIRRFAIEKSLCAKGMCQTRAII
jgi:sugar lactone lactonase YvrE